MRNALLRSLAVITVGLAVLVGVLYVATTVDARPPEVIEVRLTQAVPSDPQRALITSSIEVAFSEPVEEAGAAAALRITPHVDGSISWSATTMTFTPAQPLALDTEFEVQVAAGVTDEAGNVMGEPSEPFSFETTGRPVVVDSDPADGEDQVPLDAAIVLTFSTLMDTSAVEAALSVAPLFAHDLRWSGDLLEIVPTRPLAPDRAYEITIAPDAADVAGVALGEPFSLAFETLEAGIEVDAVVPADGSDGISGSSPIAIYFAGQVDPDSVTDELLVLEPDHAGSIDLVQLPGADGASVLRYTPSSPLPPNTTFEVELSSEVRSLDGGRLAEPRQWTFTTGAPLTTLSNQLVFLSDRSGVANLWAMNPDGTGPRQLSAELSPIVDYAVAPDGRSFVVADGRRLVVQRPDGSERRMLTDEGFLEFDPTYAPDSRRLAFGRADAETGAGLGLWEVDTGGGDSRPIELPQELQASPSVSGQPVVDEGRLESRPLLRAPRYAPDGQALAFVDAAGRVGIVELPAQRLTVDEFAAAGPPTWLLDGSGILLAGNDASGVAGGAGTAPPGGSVPPLDAPSDGSPLEQPRIVIFSRSGGFVTETELGTPALAPVAGNGGRIAFLRPEDDAPREHGAQLRVAASVDDRSLAARGLGDLPVSSATFAPEPGTLTLAVHARGDALEAAGIWLFNVETGVLVDLEQEGWRPRWLP